MEVCHAATMTDDNIYAVMEKRIYQQLYQQLSKDFNGTVKGYFGCEFDDKLDAMIELRVAEMFNQSTQSVSALDKTLPKNDHDARSAVETALKTTFEERLSAVEGSLTHWSPKLDKLYNPP